MIAKLFIVALAAALPLSQAIATEATGRAPEIAAAAWAAIAVAAQAEMEDKHPASLVVAIVGPDGILWSGAYGFENEAKTRPVTLDSVYRVGSITDALTALLVRDLANAGRLDLDRPVTAYLPDFKPANPFRGVITLRTLLAHKSGLVREPPVGGSFATDEPSLAATVRSLNGISLVAAPGTTVKYSNAGLAVAARTLEVVTGEDYDDFLQSRILIPLGLRDSALRRHRVKAPVYAEMAPFDSSRFTAPVFDFGAQSEGGLYTSMRDLVQLTRMLIRRTDGNGAAFPSFQPGNVGDWRTLECAGAVYGFASDILVVPGEGLAVIILDALDGSPTPRRLARYATTVLAATREGQSVPMWPRSSAYGARAVEVAGVFRHSRDSLAMRSIDGRLYLEGPTVAAEVRRTPDELVLDDSGTYSTDLQVSASANRVVLFGDSYDRVTASEPPRPAPSIEDIVGDYGWPHAYIRVYERDGRAYSRTTWSTYEPLTAAAGKDLWALPTSGGPYRLETIRFQRDARGRVNAANLGGLVLPRRDFGVEAAAVLRESMRPIASLRAAALATHPPVQPESKRATELVELTPRIAGLRLDIRYATINNFLQTPVYGQARAFLQRPAAEALRLVAADLAPKGFGLTIFDAYRPWSVTKMFWDATPESSRVFVADPSQGSRHNRGAAVDLTLHELKSGDIVTMPGAYDEMSSHSYSLYVGGTSLQRWRRDVLREAMETRGFTVYEPEWWHFDFNDWKDFPLSNVEFSEIGQ